MTHRGPPQPRTFCDSVNAAKGWEKSPRGNRDAADARINPEMKAPSSAGTPRTRTDVSSPGTPSLSPDRKLLRNQAAGPRAKSPGSPLPHGRQLGPRQHGLHGSSRGTTRALSQPRCDRAHKSPGSVRSESQAPGMAPQGNRSPRSSAKGIHSLEATGCRSLWQPPGDESIRRSHPASWPVIKGRFLPRKPGACTAA